MQKKVIIEKVIIKFKKSIIIKVLRNKKNQIHKNVKF